MSNSFSHNKQLINDKTDAWSAFATFAAVRTLFFILLFLALAILQVCFWAVNSGSMDKALHIDNSGILEIICPNHNYTTPKPGNYNCTAAISNYHSITNNNSSTSPNPCINDSNISGMIFTTEKPIPLTGRHVDKIQLIQSGLKAAKYLLSFAAIMYFFCMLAGLMMAIAGSLGGLANMTRALFLSLLVMVMVVSWQHSFAPGAPGVAFSYNGLIDHYKHMRISNDTTYTFFYYCRFVGLWAIAMIALLLAQWRSFKALKNIQLRIMAILQQNPIYPPSAHSNLANPEYVPVPQPEPAPIPLEPADDINNNKSDNN